MALEQDHEYIMYQGLAETNQQMHGCIQDPNACIVTVENVDFRCYSLTDSFSYVWFRISCVLFRGVIIRCVEHMGILRL